MEKWIGIIADDLTGANDSGVQLTEKGIPTSVLFDIPKGSDKLDQGIVMDTDSRSLPLEKALTVTKEASVLLKKAGYRYIYKKMDSTLRGHIGAELHEVQKVFNPEFIVIAPAFPAYGRVTKNGIHYVNGVKLAETEAAKDPKHPVAESFVPDMITDAIGQKVAFLKTEELDKELFSEKVSFFRKENIHYIVCDAETQEDLNQIAQNFSAISDQVVWAGSAGLAEVLPEVLGYNSNDRKRDFHFAKQVMTVCGSLSEITQTQVKYAASQPGIDAIELDPVAMFNNEWKDAKHSYMEKCIEKENDLVLYVPSTDVVRQQVKEEAAKHGYKGFKVSERISQAIGEIVVEVSKRKDTLTGFVLTGGDTAKEVSRQLGGVGFQLVKQLEAGIPLGKLIGPVREYNVVTNAGAFGNEDSIYLAMRKLKGEIN